MKITVLTFLVKKCKCVLLYASIFIVKNAFLTSKTFLEVNIKHLHCKILLFILKTLKVKPKNPLALAGGIRFPEEGATACLALSLGKRDLAPHHHLPDSSFLLILRRQQEHLSLCRHHLGHSLQQDQESQILQQERPCKAVAPTIVSPTI